MRSRSPLRARLLAALLPLLAAGGLAAGPALPAAAAPAAAASHHRVLTYAALGDSYAAGQAVDCTHTATSYPVLLDALHRVKLLRDTACAGATTSDVRTTQLAALQRGVKLVTITVGGNDLDVAGLQRACAPDPSSRTCLLAIAARAAELPALYRSLVATYSAVAADAPHAEILVTGYPLLVASGPLAAAEATLNDTIRAAVATVAATGVNIRYVDVQFTGHTVGTPDPWFVLSGPNIFHPNAAGNAAIAAALAAAIR